VPAEGWYSGLQWVAVSCSVLPCLQRVSTCLQRGDTASCSVLLWCVEACFRLPAARACRGAIQWVAVSCSVLHRITASSSVLPCVAACYRLHAARACQGATVRCSELQRTAVFCRVLQHITNCMQHVPAEGWYSELQWFAVCSSVLQRVAVFCRVLQRVIDCLQHVPAEGRYSVLQCVAVCYSVLQCVAACFRLPAAHACRGVKQRVAVCCSE